MMTNLEYRAYILDADSHVRLRIDLLCADDESAKAEAKQLVDEHDVELWLECRKVTTFKHSQ